MAVFLARTPRAARSAWARSGRRRCGRRPNGRPETTWGAALTAIDQRGRDAARGVARVRTTRGAARWSAGCAKPARCWLPGRPEHRGRGPTRAAPWSAMRVEVSWRAANSAASPQVRATSSAAPRVRATASAAAGMYRDAR
jgi:hypothetical protein